MKYKNIYLSVLIVVICCFFISIDAYAKNPVIVIDPGHGGDSLGGNYEDRIERDINLITAMEMKAVLDKYDNIDVYITRTNNDDPDINRKKRLEIAKDVDADFFYAIHYNMSEYHELYGAEIWVPMSGIGYSKGMEFANIEMQLLKDAGLFERGIKHRISDKTNEEYYGILKWGVEFDIPAVIIEHCHLDNINDSDFWNDEKYKELGRIDAQAVIDYFDLDGKKIERKTYDIPSKKILPDRTAPEYCEVELTDVDLDNAKANVKIKSSDSDGYIQYYSISTDGGKHFGPFLPWENRELDIQLYKDIQLLPGEESFLVVKTLNQYDLSTSSDVVVLPGATVTEETIEEEHVKDTSEYTTEEIVVPVVENVNPFMDNLTIIIGVVVLIMGTIAFAFGMIINNG